MKRMNNFKKEFSRYPATYSLAIITLGVWLSQFLANGVQATEPMNLFHFGALFGPDLIEHPTHLWRLVTPIFVHIGWEHFFFNALTLYFVGQIAEQIWGSHKFLALYILSGITGNVFTLFFTPKVVAAGASTSLFGVFAAIMIVGYFGRNPYLKELGRAYQALIAINLLFNLFMPNVGITGHIGGLLGGALCAVFLPTFLERNMFKKWQRLVAAGAYILITVVLVGMALF